MMTETEREQADRQEAEDTKYLDDQLRRIREYLLTHNAPEEFLDVIDYFIEDNLRWLGSSEWN